MRLDLKTQRGDLQVCLTHLLSLYLCICLDMSLCCLEILNDFEQESLHRHFALSPINSGSDPATEQESGCTGRPAPNLGVNVSRLGWSCLSGLTERSPSCS